MSESPKLSIVVGLISGRKADLRRCLGALRSQTFSAPLEVIVPYDDACADVASLAEEFPAVKFIRAAGFDTRRARAGATREHHDTLRTIGLRAATAEFVALTEDHAYAAAGWCDEMVGALERHHATGASGGAVDCDHRGALGVAVWFCDFGRYQSPLPEGPSEFVSDSNVIYRRTALEAVTAAWRDDYHETAVHRALVEAGYELRTAPRAVVWQARSGLTLGRAIRERYVWGRSFAGTRATTIGTAKRSIFAVLSPMLPFVMTWRIFRTTVQRRRNRARFVRSLPLIALLQAAWAFGEWVGYVTAVPTRHPGHAAHEPEAEVRPSEMRRTIARGAEPR